jgi:hypothetical protein
MVIRKPNESSDMLSLGAKAIKDYLNQIWP